MRYLSLGGTLALTAFLATDLLASVFAALLWRAARGDLRRLPARSCAHALFLLRVFPSVAACTVVFGMLLPAFWRFEPRESSEIMGESLVVLAVASLLLIAAGLRRGWRASRATRRVAAEWLAHAQPVTLPGVRVRAFRIKSDFPVVSLVGILRPRLFVSERVLGECTAEELAAVLRHECGHLAARDNLKRLVLRICPTPLLMASADDEIERRWHDASEEAADDYAARASAPSALALANALVRVARMAPAGAMKRAITALYDGSGIERRVKRLIDGRPPSAARPGWLLTTHVLTLVPLVMAFAVLLDVRLLRTVYHVVEAVVEVLP